MAEGDQQIDVVIRTAGEPARHRSLERAIRSILDQRDVAARPIVVIAGERPADAAELASRHGSRVHVIGKTAPPGRALAIGRRLVEADYFAFLDDDDELLADALATRLAPMRTDPAIDVVVTSGFRTAGEARHIDIPDITRHQADPLNGIIERCWLPSCAGLFRTAAIGPGYFDGLPDLCEWTALAFRLAVHRRNIHFLDVASYNVNDTPESLSKGDEFVEEMLRVLGTMRSHALPEAARAKLERKYRAAMHGAAEHYRRSGHATKAWRYHLKSMRPPYTLHYGSYTRKLLWFARVRP